MTFAEKLIELRKSKGWSQEELGDKLGVTRQTISKWELGFTTPEMEKIAALSELFGITTDELIKGTEPKTAAVFPEEKIPDGSEVIFVERRRKFTGEYKSKKTFRGIPLVHVNLKGAAKGIIAVGPAAKGVIAVGLAALGVVSVGVAALGVLAIGGFIALGLIANGALSIGILSLGGVSLGVFSMGGVSAGWFSFGGVSAGTYAIGGSASGDIAVGGVANGIIAVGEKAHGEIVFNPPVNAEEFRAAVLSRLPNTPKFIVDIMTAFAENLTVD